MTLPYTLTGQGGKIAPPDPYKAQVMTLATHFKTISNYCDEHQASGKVLSFYQVLGVLTAINSAPRGIDPGLWLGLILPELNPEQEPEAEVVAFVDTLVVVAEEIGHQLYQEQFSLPDACRYDGTLSQQQPLSQWAQGFLATHIAMENVWESAIDSLSDTRDETEQELLTITSILAATADIQAALEMAQQEQNDQFEQLLPELDQFVLQSVNNYFQIGQALYVEHDAPQVETFVREQPKIGRNDPCFCGSGKKFKKCCGQ